MPTYTGKFTINAATGELSYSLNSGETIVTTAPISFDLTDEDILDFDADEITCELMACGGDWVIPNPYFSAWPKNGSVAKHLIPDPSAKRPRYRLKIPESTCIRG